MGEYVAWGRRLGARETEGVAKQVVFGDHAREKFILLYRHGFMVSEEQVRDTVQTPERVEEGYRGRKVAQRGITERHVLRIVYEDGPTEISIVTFYPGRRNRYES